MSTKSYYGHFIAFSDTGAANILMGANDDATGTFNDRVFKKGNIGYLENYNSYTHFEKATFWRSQAKTWIKKNPLKWLTFFPLKIAYMYGLDDWSVYALSNSDKWNSYTIAKLIFKEKQPQKVFAGESSSFICGFIFIYIIHYLYYYILLFLLLYQFFFYKKHPQLKQKYFREIYLFTFTGTLITLLAVGLARYKYNYIIFLLPTIVPIILFYLQKWFPNLKLAKNE